MTQQTGEICDNLLTMYYQYVMYILKHGSPWLVSYLDENGMIDLQCLYFHIGTLHNDNFRDKKYKRHVKRFQRILIGVDIEDSFVRDYEM